MGIGRKLAYSVGLALVFGLAIVPTPLARLPSPMPGVDSALVATPASGQVYSKLPLAFELNRGQAASDVKFLARGAGYSLQLADSGALIQLRDASVRMQIKGATADPVLGGLEVLPGTVNYFIGNDPAVWR